MIMATVSDGAVEELLLRGRISKKAKSDPLPLHLPGVLATVLCLDWRGTAD